MFYTLFTIKNKFYKHKYGTPIDPPISGLFVDIVTENLKTKRLKRLPFIPYVPNDRIGEIINVFNSYEQRLQCSYEKELNNSISILDVLLIEQNNTLITDWYDKRTSLGHFLNFNSKHPITKNSNNL